MARHDRIRSVHGGGQVGALSLKTLYLLIIARSGWTGGRDSKSCSEYSAGYKLLPRYTHKTKNRVLRALFSCSAFRDREAQKKPDACRYLCSLDTYIGFKEQEGIYSCGHA